jgi:hypothetical protein
MTHHNQTKELTT